MARKTFITRPQQLSTEAINSGFRAINQLRGAKVLYRAVQGQEEALHHFDEAPAALASALATYTAIFLRACSITGVSPEDVLATSGAQLMREEVAEALASRKAHAALEDNSSLHGTELRKQADKDAEALGEQFSARWKQWEIATFGDYSLDDDGNPREDMKFAHEREQETKLAAFMEQLQAAALARIPAEQLPQA